MLLAACRSSRVTSRLAHVLHTLTLTNAHTPAPPEPEPGPASDPNPDSAHPEPQSLQDPAPLRPLTALKWPYVPDTSAYPDPLTRDDPKPLQLQQYEAIGTCPVARPRLLLKPPRTLTRGYRHAHSNLPNDPHTARHPSPSHAPHLHRRPARPGTRRSATARTRRRQPSPQEPRRGDADDGGAGRGYEGV